MNIRKVILATLVCGLISFTAVPHAVAQAGPATGASVRHVGSIKSVSDHTLVLSSDTGSEITVTITDATRLLRVEPGQTDLKSALPLPLQEINSGDRILVRGTMSPDGKTMMASSVVAIKKEALAQKQQTELQDWRRRGTGGLVKSVDPSTGDVTIGAMSPTGPKTVVIHTNKQTVYRRYAENSIKYDEAKPSTIAEIRNGDQLRIRGSKNSDGTEFTAEEIVFGTFRNISGKITATDEARKTITVGDLTTKKPVVVRVTDNTEMHKLSEQLAQALAARLKGQRSNGNGEGPRAAQTPQSAGQRTAPNESHAPNSPEHERNGRGAGDLQQMLNRIPLMSFSEFNKDDVVMIVTSVGTPGEVTAITLLNGVEPILTASPSSSITPWNLSALGADPAGGQ